jgi:hypothetical protein
LTFNGLHGVISQEIELFITTAVRTSDPTFVLNILGSDIHKNLVISSASDTFATKKYILSTSLPTLLHVLFLLVHEMDIL